MIQWAKENRAGVIVERRGKPEAALISYAEYQAMIELKEADRKRQAFAKMVALNLSQICPRIRLPLPHDPLSSPHLTVTRSRMDIGK